LTDQKVKRFLIPIVIIVIIFSVFKQIRSDKNEKQLKLENNYVIGEITDFYSLGLEATYYIHFEYIIDGIKYEKSKNTYSIYPDCEKTKNCIGIKHPVYYDVKNPNNAFMDFNLTESEFYKRTKEKKKIKEQIDQLKIE